MITLEVKHMVSPDVEIDDSEVEAEDSVCFLLELEIGEVGDPRRDVFQVMVATPEGLRRYATAEIITNRSTIVFANFSWSGLRHEIRRTVNACSAASWPESMMKLQRFFRWEYEDYVQE